MVLHARASPVAVSSHRRVTPNSPRPSSAPSRYRRAKSGSPAPAPRMGACFLLPFLLFFRSLPVVAASSLLLSWEQHGPSWPVTGRTAAPPRPRRSIFSLVAAMAE
uniref:Uncharacterized protein n=1 Tax=Arundo donax TaxID=35708 RepID=A0A0A9AZH7_ARUDO